ncbi:MAG: hypothetical protein QOG10_3530 [Kribbellaceae bacterium]|jgi:uncharacterized protein (DUF427 family)|nr:hypothetical protein [Kribbellaceae bacterium]
MSNYPGMITPVDHVEPVPRRIRATLDGRVVLDTTRAVYLWERQSYPQYYVPLADVVDGVLVDTGETEQHERGTARVHTVGAGRDAGRDTGRARVYDEGLVAGRVRFDWDALDSWYEEDEEVFVHPRNPYSRVDAIRSSRLVQVSVDGVVLAESASTVMVFETGLPPRYYFPRTAVNFEHLVPTDTETACPYKGRTSDYWSSTAGSRLRPDLAWSYDFPTAALLPIAGLVAFYNERVALSIDGESLERVRTHFSD